VLAWLFVWSEVQTCIWPSWCRCHSLSCFSKIHIGFTFLVPAHPGSPGQRSIERVCVCVLYHLLYCVTVKYTALLQMPQYCTYYCRRLFECFKTASSIPVYKIYYLTIMPKLRSTCDGRLICKTSYKECKAFLRYDLFTTHLQSCKIAFPRESAYDIPERNLCTSFVTVVSRSYDKLMINRKIFCKSGPRILWATCTLTDSHCCSIDLSANVVYSLPS